MKGMLKLSYSLSNARREWYIVDDEDVFLYLTSVDKEGLKHVLHVELFSDLEANQRVAQLSRVERVSSVGLNYGELVSNGKAVDVENAGILTIFNPCEQQNVVNEEVLESFVNEEIIVNEECENVGQINEFVADVSDSDMDDRHEYVELPFNVEKSQFNEWEDGTGLEINQEFCSKEAVQDLVHRVANKNCFNIKTVKSDAGRLMLRYKQASKGCKWYLHVARVKNSDYFSVRVHRKMHTCSRCVASTSISKQKGSTRLVASILHDDYPGQFDTPTPKNIMNIVQRRLGLQLSYSTALRGKKQNVSDVRGSPEASYAKLYSYLHMLETVNPGTVTQVELDAEKRFKYLFIALGACIEGFRAMRKVIVVDATHLKTKYGGRLVFATAQDPNHHHYPIAFGVLDGEKDVSWSWFFKMLKTVILEEPELVFMSDRHGSIIKAVSEVYPSALHGHCVWHLSQNVKKAKTDKNDVALKFVECAHIYTKNEFEKEYGNFMRRFPTMADYLDKSIGYWERMSYVTVCVPLPV
ncbi:PREDICTED: protein FAR-RED ELONGATED HYPOCOTYL 3-like [Camelina sativa]|uniref:Protein FAR-RED ELONGATED HYPOCOTYL 3-like n=1 Tax=Camelina sativa TaxID=90675 RepID=A0ABM0TDK6_CAMSA|nr:PREDICTED: protein FAR-RED ELONGATED HYPOCOTYL 3-like [Camelina sativa]